MSNMKETFSAQACIDFESYLFPMPELANYTDTKLLAYIKKNLRGALDQTDGSDINSDVKIDIAQDTIEQARDIMVIRGHVFTAEDQSKLSFLKWPLTPEQEAKKCRQEESEQQAGKEWFIERNSIKSKVTPLVLALLNNEQLPDIQIPEGVTVNFGWSTNHQPSTAPNGAEVLLMKAKLESVIETEFDFNIGSFKWPPLEAADDPEPWWQFRVPLTTNREVWRLINTWWLERKINEPYFWCGPYHWDMYGQWPEQESPVVKDIRLMKIMDTNEDAEYLEIKCRAKYRRNIAAKIGILIGIALILISEGYLRLYGYR